MKHAWLFLATLLLGGCIALPIPNDRQVSPEFYGVVTDIDSGMPISDEKVRVSISESSSAGTTTSEVGTTANGKYQVKVEEHSTWYVLFLGPAEGTCRGVLSVDHPDYETQSTSASQFRGAAVNGMCNGYKVQRDIQLKRKPFQSGAE